MLPAIIVHFLNNGLSVTFDLLYEYQVMPAEMVNLCYSVIIIVTGVLSLLFIRKFAKGDENFFSLKRADDVIPYRNKMKAVASSPTLISFASVMILFSLYVLFMPYLVGWGVISN